MEKICNFTLVKAAHSLECLTSGKDIRSPLGDGRQHLNSKGFSRYSLSLKQGSPMVRVSVPLLGLSCQLNYGVQTAHRDIKTSSDYIAIASEGAELNQRRYEDLTETIAINPLNFFLGVRGAHSVLTSLLQ